MMNLRSVEVKQEMQDIHKSHSCRNKKLTPIVNESMSVLPKLKETYSNMQHN